ncbi:unnamed protein product [Heligmosomoides polygyrus]|uniref:Uncharacterized protein n=1 Tax=Heligmosomoides polygyrus TaxID=6339 RepID=A0A183F4F3_HELPZ|nr:unnamed protein product [Heligmosomoides polygyrus]
MLMVRPLLICHSESSLSECQQHGFRKSQLSSSARAAESMDVKGSEWKTNGDDKRIGSDLAARRGRGDRHYATASTTCPIMGPPHAKRPKKSHRYAAFRGPTRDRRLFLHSTRPQHDDSSLTEQRAPARPPLLRSVIPTGRGAGIFKCRGGSAGRSA